MILYVRQIGPIVIRIRKIGKLSGVHKAAAADLSFENNSALHGNQRFWRAGSCTKLQHLVECTICLASLVSSTIQVSHSKHSNSVGFHWQDKSAVVLRTDHAPGSALFWLSPKASWPERHLTPAKVFPLQLVVKIYLRDQVRHSYGKFLCAVADRTQIRWILQQRPSEQFFTSQIASSKEIWQSWLQTSLD